ncbi:MAG: glycosyltransferase family 4 protein [Calditrichia bacterium]
MQSKLRILFISQYFPPEMGAPSARTFELARKWTHEGHSVTIVTAFPNHPTGIIPPDYPQHLYKREKNGEIDVIRTYIYPVANKGFFKRILSYLSFMFSSVILGPWRTGPVDIIIATSPQFFVAVAGYLMSIIKWKPFIFEVRDLWPESIVQLGQLKNRTIIRVLEAMEVFLYRKAKDVVVVTESSVSIIEQKGINREKLHIIKNGVDLELFHPAEAKADLRKKLGLKDKFVISYIGTHGLSHALDKVLETAALMQENEDIHFLLVGEGAEKEKLLRMKEELQLGNVTMLSQIDKQELPDYYNMCDIVLITLRDLDLFRCVIPSKMFEIMAVAKPILISVDGEARQIVVHSAKAGHFVAPEDPNAMRDGILKLYNNPETCQELGKNGRRFVEDYFNRDQLALDYLEVLQAAVNGGGNSEIQ